jgi:hypothetical protein
LVNSSSTIQSGGKRRAEGIELDFSTWAPHWSATAAAARSTGYRSSDAASGSLAKLAAIASDLPDRIASAFLLLPLFGKQSDYQLPV